jgi:hypothetical protein
MTFIFLKLLIMKTIKFIALIFLVKGDGIINRKDYTNRKEKTLFPPNFLNKTTLVAVN